MAKLGFGMIMNVLLKLSPATLIVSNYLVPHTNLCISGIAGKLAMQW